MFTALKFLDLEKIDAITDCISLAEAKTGQTGCFKNDVWSLYRERMKIEEMDHFAFFDFDEQICNLYRSGGYFANSDFSRMSLKQHAGFANFETHHANQYPELTTSRDSGIKLAKPKVNFDAYLKEVLLAKFGEAELKRVFLDNSPFN